MKLLKMGIIFIYRPFFNIQVIKCLRRGSECHTCQEKLQQFELAVFTHAFVLVVVIIIIRIVLTTLTVLICLLYTS